MIQVCSRCGTRWNVRDRQRVWCPRCNGTLLMPSAAPPPSEWSPRPTAPPMRPGSQNVPPRLPPGFRWIAVRPGAPPPARRRQRNLGPTPRYPVIPRWGLVERFDTADFEQQAALAPRAVACGAARHTGRDDHGARYRRVGAHRAIRVADHQPQRALESGGGMVGRPGWAFWSALPPSSWCSPPSCC